MQDDGGSTSTTRSSLHGLQQHYVKLEENAKNRKLNELLDALEFNQVVVFVKSVQRAVQLDKLLQECNFPSVAIHASMKQEEHQDKQNFKDFKHHPRLHRHLGRGIDIERVNIVVATTCPTRRLLPPRRPRGRFGTKGLAITFASNDEDAKILESVQSRFESPSPSCPRASTSPPHDRVRERARARRKGGGAGGRKAAAAAAARARARACASHTSVAGRGLPEVVCSGGGRTHKLLLIGRKARGRPGGCL